MHTASHLQYYTILTYDYGVDILHLTIVRAYSTSILTSTHKKTTRFADAWLDQRQAPLICVLCYAHNYATISHYAPPGGFA